MSGIAASGEPLAPNLSEWHITYYVEIKPEGEKIAEYWFDPRR